jgi:hypothetical protein
MNEGTKEIHMRKIAISVVICYVALLILLTLPVMVARSGLPEFSLWLTRSLEIFTDHIYWIFIGVFALCHVVLLCVPLRIARERPIARRHIWIPVAVTGFLLACLVLGVCYAVSEVWYLGQRRTFSSIDYHYFIYLIPGLIWIAWAVFFYIYVRRQDAEAIVRLQSKWLFRSSLLGLLVAVPMHIVARSRDECCAGYGTFVAIAFGIPIMLMSFGPGVFFLYASRWKRLHPNNHQETPHE